VKKKQKYDPAQLELDLRVAEKTLMDAAVAYADLRRQAKEAEAVAPAAPAEADEKMERDRKLFRRLVGHLATAFYGGDFHVAYVEVYQELCRVTGYHPAADLLAPRETHLSKVCEKGLLDKALQCVRGLLASPIRAMPGMANV